MEKYFDQVLKQQQQVNDDLVGFFNYLERLINDDSDDKNDYQSSPLVNVFGLKGSTVKPSFLFSNTPDIKQHAEFRSYYIEKALNRQLAFNSSFRNKNSRESNNDNSFIEMLELLFSENANYLDKLNDLKILYEIKQLILKYERKNELQSYQDFNNEKTTKSFTHQPNNPLIDETSIIHRLIITSELFSPYELTSEITHNTALKSFQIILNGNSKIFKKRLSLLPIYSDIYSSLIEECDKNFSTLRKDIFPQPSDNSRKEISIDQIEWLSTKYLPNIFRHRIDWENSLTMRSELIYKFLSYFSKQPNEKSTKKDWSSIICSQYPIMVKRNDQYMLIFGIRWKPFSNIKTAIQSLKGKGLYGLEFNSEHFNNFPFFFGDGKECISTERPNISSNLLRDFRETLKNQIIDRSGTRKYSFPKYPPFRHWIFDHFFNQSILIKNDFLAVMEGRRSLFEIILKYRPDIILENQIYGTLIKQLEECLKRNHLFKKDVTFTDLKSIQIPESSKYYSLFLPFYYHIDDYEMQRTDHLFSSNFKEFIRYFSRALCELSDSNINLTKVEFLQLLQLRESIQENIVFNHKNHNNFLFSTCHTSRAYRGNNIFDLIPSLIETIRSSMKYLRTDNLYWKLYMRGLYIPENPILHRDFIRQYIKTFLNTLKNQQDKLTKKFNTRQEDMNLLKDNLTLISRFLNLKWKKPLSYIRIMTPSTRLVISKLVKTYFQPLEHVLQQGSNSQTNLVNNIVPFESKVSNFALNLLEVSPSHHNGHEEILVETVKTFIGKYKHDVNNCGSQLANRLLFLFLNECCLKNIITTDNLPKLVIIYKKYVNDNSCLSPNVFMIEQEILSLKIGSHNLEKIETINSTVPRLYPVIGSNSLMLRNNFIDISSLKALIWNSLESKYLVSSINVIIANFEQENTYIWNNMLEQSFDLLALESVKHNISSVFPIKNRELEVKEWSVHYKRLQKLGKEYLQYYPFNDSHANPVTLSKKSVATKFEGSDMIDMFFPSVDTFNSNSRLILDNSINSSSLRNSSSNIHHRQFGFIYNDLSKDNMKKTNQLESDWDLTLTIKCMSRRIIRKLKQATQRKEILGRIETTFNVSSDLSKEIIELSTEIIQLLEKHSMKDSKLFTKFNKILSEKQKFASLQELIEQVLNFCKEYENSRIVTEYNTDSPEQILLPIEKSSHCPCEIVRNSIKNNELYSLVPFIDRTLNRSKTKEVISNTLTKHEDSLFQHQTKTVEPSSFLHYFEETIQNIVTNSFENSFHENIIDFSYILSYGKVKILNPSRYDESFNSVFITEAEASYMNVNDRPSFYKSTDLEWDTLNKNFPSHVVCENIEKLEKLASEGVDSRMVFGGFCGGNCEVLLFHPDCEELKSGNTEMSYMKESLAKRKVECFGEISCGWMNLDDLVGPGIELTNATHGDINRENIWISNECCTFNYNPNKTLEENNFERKAKQKANKGLMYVNHPKRIDQLYCGHHHLRETIPMYDLKFLFYSAIPFTFKEFHDNK